MRFLLFVFCFAVALNVQAQELKKKISGRGFSNEREEYYVLKSNPEIKHGKYLKLTNTYGTTIESGYYRNNLKDSVWTEFYPGTKEYISRGNYKEGKKDGLWVYRKYSNNLLYINEKGVYQDDKRIGPWQTYNILGEVITVYDYSLEKLYYEKPKPDSLEYQVFNEDGWTTRKLDKAPVLKDNLSAVDYGKAIYNEAKFPMVSGISGKAFIVVSFIVDEAGNESEHKIEVPLEPKLDKELLRAKIAVQKQWHPGILEGKPIKTKIRFPVIFNFK